MVRVATPDSLASVSPRESGAELPAEQIEDIVRAARRACYRALPMVATA